jgi:glycosyltransferase involved in cell wall biosynthesis
LARLGAEVLMITPARWQDFSTSCTRILRASLQRHKWTLLYLPCEAEGQIFNYTIREAWEPINKFQPDWIFSDSEPCAAQSVLSLKWARKLGCKLASFSWENIFKNYGGSRSRVERKVLAGSDAVIVGNEGAREVLTKKGCSPEKIFKVLETGIDTEMYKPMNMPRKYDCLFVGRRVWEKGIEVIDKALDDLPEARMLWVGKGSYTPRHGEVRGYVAEDDLPATYNRARLFLYPSIPTESWQEQGFYSGLEALACGTPVVATTTGAIPELVGDCKAAYLVPPNDPARLGNAIEIMHHRDLLEREVIQTEARQFILERYSLPVIAKKYSEVFRT